MILADEINVLDSGRAGLITGIVVTGSGLLISKPKVLPNSGVWPFQRKVFLKPLASDSGDNTPAMESGRQFAFLKKADSHESLIFFSFEARDTLQSDESNS